MAIENDLDIAVFRAFGLSADDAFNVMESTCPWRADAVAKAIAELQRDEAI
jgi:hypothetical protein